MFSLMQASLASFLERFVTETTLRETNKTLGATSLWQAWEASPDLATKTLLATRVL